jgi:hypothetical protein
MMCAMTTVETKFKIASWDETTVHELPDGHKVTRVNVPLSVSAPRVEANGTFSAVMHYDATGASIYLGLLCVEGTLDGRSGSFVLRETGTFDGKVSRAELSIVPWSGTGELAGIQGSGLSVSTHEDVPFMPMTLDYELA